jgi:PAS domain S-box-containing protein
MSRKPSYTDLMNRIEELEARKAAWEGHVRAEWGDDGLLKTSDRSFRDLVENSLTGISILMEEKVVYRNPEQERIFGPLKDDGAPSIYERVHPNDLEKLQGLIQATLAGHARQAGIVIRFVNLWGDTVGENAMKWLHCRTNLIDLQGRKAVLINMMDVTKAREAERLLNIRDRMISLGHVTTGIAHEIRNPLSGINIYLDTAEQILQRGGDPEKMKEIIGKIQAASSKIEAVIRRVMDFSKPSEPRLESIDIHKPIEEALGLCAVLLRKTGVEIITDLAPGLPPCKADAQLIEQVVLNLITNAAEAMKGMEKRKKIKICTSRKGPCIVVSVADTGPGVPPDLAQKIFDPFFTTKKSSTGIGLSLCQRVIHDHGGILKVSHGPLGGAEFSFSIPVNP